MTATAPVLPPMLSRMPRYPCPCGRSVASTAPVYSTTDGRRYVALRAHNRPEGGRCGQSTVRVTS